MTPVAHRLFQMAYRNGPIGSRGRGDPRSPCDEGSARNTSEYMSRSPRSVPDPGACPRGHLDEFPWVEFTHTGTPCTGHPSLTAYETGTGARSTDLQVECSTCGRKRHLSQELGLLVRGGSSPGACHATS